MRLRITGYLRKPRAGNYDGRRSRKPVLHRVYDGGIRRVAVAYVIHIDDQYFVRRFEAQSLGKRGPRGLRWLTPVARLTKMTRQIAEASSFLFS